jgi:acetyl-CoA carboxylase carboxyltransferase component
MDTGLKEKLKDFDSQVRQLQQGGGPAALQKQHDIGKMTARERIDALVDKDSFQELGLFVKHQCQNFDMAKKELPADGVVTGIATIDGKPVCVYAQDFTVSGGSLGLAHARKITRVMDLAMDMKVPCIGINDSGGARIQEGISALTGYGEIFFHNTAASGVIPQISVILGPCAGGAVYSPALTDFVFVVDKVSKMFITGPEVIKTVLGEEIGMEELGGARVHTEITGNAHFFAENEMECFAQIRRLLSFIPHNNEGEKEENNPCKEPNHEFVNIYNYIPDDPREPFDVCNVIKAVVDDSDFIEVHQGFAQNAVVGFARLNGHVIGVIANQPMVLAGVLDIDSSDKIARFIRYCDAFNIPLVTFEDMPGYLPGVDQEHSGIIRHGAKVLYAYCEATVPKLTVIMRKAYGGGYIAMCSRQMKADFVYAWPTAEIAVMGPAGAANIIFRKDIKEAEDPEAMRNLKIEEYKKKFANPYVAASYSWVDAVIDPADTRRYLIQALEMAKGKKVEQIKKKHGIPPF